MIAPAGQAVRGKAHSTWPLSGTPPPPRTWGLNPAQSWGGGSWAASLGVQNRARGEGRQARTALPHLAQGAAGTCAMAIAIPAPARPAPAALPGTAPVRRLYWLRPPSPRAL